MTNDTVHSYTYDAEGNITKVDNGSTGTYTYNALNQRVKTVANGATTEFVYNANGQRVSEWNAANHAQLKGHYYWGGKPVAFYTVASNGAQTAHFQHQDWLGTERMRTSYSYTGSSSIEGTFTSMPWGDGLAQTTSGGTDADTNHFATLDHDTESNTDHAEFRQYSNTQGRFLSPDPYDGSYDPTNPQSMNRYVYAMNNPLSNIDPSGRDCIYDNGFGSYTTEYGDCASTSDGGYYINCEGCLNGVTVTGIIQDQNPNIVDLAAYTTSAGLYSVNGNLLDPTASISVNANPPQLAVAGVSVGGPSPTPSGGGSGGGAPSNQQPNVIVRAPDKHDLLNNSFCGQLYLGHEAFNKAAEQDLARGVATFPSKGPLSELFFSTSAVEGGAALVELFGFTLACP